MQRSEARPRPALTDGGNEGGVEGVLREAEQGTGLAHARVADEQQFEQIVVGLRHVGGHRPPLAPRSLAEPRRERTEPARHWPLALTRAHAALPLAAGPTAAVPSLPATDGRGRAVE